MAVTALRTRVVTIAVFLWASPAHAGGILDFIRNYDLNDYALGIAYSVSQKPYFGSENSGFAYPYLTSFRHNAFTDDWLILTGGEAGFRWVSQSDWILGAVGRINTQGTGVNALEDLLGLESRNWAVEMSPVVGWRRWPVHLEMRHYVEVFSDYGGPATELWASLPNEFRWGWVVPSVRFIRNSSDRNRYYYGVATDEIPGVDPYIPGSSSNVMLDLNVGWAITDKWLLSGRISHEWLGSEITDSPIVTRDSLWSGNIGIAYNHDVFRGIGYEGESFRIPGLELRAGIYRNNTDSKFIRLPTGGGPAEEVRLEDVLGVNKKDDILHIDGVFRFAHFHRLQFGYLELGRDSTTTLLQDLVVGDEVFPAGTQIDVDTNLESWRLSYGFSLMNDAQKELGVLAGMHVTEVESRILAPETGQVVESKFDTPLPVVGVFGSVAITEKTDVGARIELFRMEFDRYEGSLNAFYIGVNHYFTDTIGAGIGYNYFAMNLDSPDQGLRGSVRIRHHGPIFFASFNF